MLALSRGQDLDLDHQALKIDARVFILTGSEALLPFDSLSADRGIEVVALAEPSPAAAIHFLRHELGAATISIEAGPLRGVLPGFPWVA